jgi:uncharacterized membrane protein YozB (DUF420 family)
MVVSPTKSRLMLVVCVVLVVAVGVVVALGVIPPVRVATHPDIAPESAVPAFWAGASLQILAALILVLTAALSKGRSGFSTSCLVVSGILVLFLGFALSDAARAFRDVGMQSVATILLACVAADALAGALAITTAFLRSKEMREGLTSASSGRAEGSR